jgi:lipopolysaccharide export system protein LptC
MPVPQAAQPQTAGRPGPPPTDRGLPAAPPPRLSGRNSYSIFVGFLKVLLPALAVALILLVVIWPQLSRDSRDFRIRVSDTSLEQADSLTMLNARFEGVDDKDQPFTLTADEATQTTDDENLIRLELPKGDITLEDGTWLAMTAREGRYRRDTQVLELSGEVTLFHDRGFELRTQAARVDLEAGIAEGSETVEGQGPFGDLVAEGFEVLDRGARVLFTGRSRAVLYPQAERAEQ